MDNQLKEIFKNKATEIGTRVINDEMNRFSEQQRVLMQVTGETILKRLRYEMDIILKDLPNVGIKTGE